MVAETDDPIIAVPTERQSNRREKRSKDVDHQHHHETCVGFVWMSGSFLLLYSDCHFVDVTVPVFCLENDLPRSRKQSCKRVVRHA